MQEKENSELFAPLPRALSPLGRGWTFPSASHFQVEESPLSDVSAYLRSLLTAPQGRGKDLAGQWGLQQEMGTHPSQPTWATHTVHPLSTSRRSQGLLSAVGAPSPPMQILRLFHVLPRKWRTLSTRCLYQFGFAAWEIIPKLARLRQFHLLAQDCESAGRCWPEPVWLVPAGSWLRHSHSCVWELIPSVSHHPADQPRLSHRVLMRELPRAAREDSSKN